MKVHVLMTKEELDTEKITSTKSVVIFDILLATSTIAACFDRGAQSIRPALNEEEALRLIESCEGEAVLAGEVNGKTIEGFLDPLPTLLIEHVSDKHIVLSTTNGTIAIRKAAGAKKVWTASLLNTEVVVEKVIEHYEDETLLLVCSGSAGQFCLEDFYGAGYFISCLQMKYNEQLELTDSALGAKWFYESYQDESEQVLKKSRVGTSLEQHDHCSEIQYVSQKSIIRSAPYVKDGLIVLE
ncbi:2-phosphosulfolactate phosphatase [Sporosarcina sp. P19]|uniref:2-phosphosulfolactate phosphatase n=1 Tax=Sporosarcina sp. P19 TaxID=2048258 RepID=UPI000C168619|nr:2-phosphosulfolactate phosphatase [Sporosarcina sp. P19]PIC78037.1 2-phosphosulfolactate phosphatase [Sporosarcina sp. P19]